MEILADCAAHPDDDGPRLVWADQVGGERGELVVAQCDLARGGLSAGDARARRARERDLLERHAVEWAGDLPEVADRWSFRRGFVETIKVSLGRLDGILRIRAAAPLLHSVVVTHAHNGVIDDAHVRALHGIRGLGLVGDYIGDAFVAVAPAIRELGLRALALDGLDASCLPAVLDIVARSPIVQLRLRNLRLTPQQLARLLDAAPQLTALELDPTPLTVTVDDPSPRRALIEIATRRPLVALRLGMVTGEDLAPLGTSTAAATLSRLGLELLGEQLELAPSLRLRTIELGGNATAAAMALLRSPPASLREIRFAAEVAAAARVELADRLGSQLELLEPPPVDLSMFTGTREEELLHPDALLELGVPYFASAPPFYLVRIDQQPRRVWELPALPASERILIGRGSVPVTVFSGTVARRHAAIHWRGDHHEMVDLGSTNGMRIGGERATKMRLCDGDDVQLGEAVLRYLVGPGARERADAYANIG